MMSISGEGTAKQQPKPEKKKPKRVAPKAEKVGYWGHRVRKATTQTERDYIMMTATKIEIVAEAITLEAEGKLVKKELAEKHNISTRTLGRYIDRYTAEAKQHISDKMAEEKVNAAYDEEGFKKDEATSSDKAPTKRELAEAIFDEMDGHRRKDIIKAFQEKAGLTEQGAATYYYNITRSRKSEAASA